MKKWPDDDKPASFEDIATPFVKAIEFAYDIKRKNSDQSIPYNGYENGNPAGLPSIGTLFSAESLKYDLEEQGRDALMVIINAAIQVGIEQGRRIALNSSEVETLRVMAKIAEVKFGLNDIHL